MVLLLAFVGVLAGDFFEFDLLAWGIGGVTLAVTVGNDCVTFAVSCWCLLYCFK